MRQSGPVVVGPELAQFAVVRQQQDLYAPPPPLPERELAEQSAQQLVSLYFPPWPTQQSPVVTMAGLIAMARPVVEASLVWLAIEQLQR